MAKRLSQRKRDLVKQKTGDKCAYCGADLNYANRNFDHVVPTAHGGTNAVENLLPACGSCNKSKGNKSLSQYRLYCQYARPVAEAGLHQRQIQWLESLGLGYQVGAKDSHTFHFETHEVGA